MSINSIPLDLFASSFKISLGDGEMWATWCQVYMSMNWEIPTGNDFKNKYQNDEMNGGENNRFA